MITAFAFSTLFLVSYILHHALHGDVRYPLMRPFADLLPFAAGQPHCSGSRGAADGAGHLLLFAHPAAFPQHRKVARWTFPIWLYVSVTGVITYVMLRLAQGIKTDMPTAEQSKPQSTLPGRRTARANCCDGADRWSARACLRPLPAETVLGGFSRTGASTNSGWFALIVALMCIPFGGLCCCWASPSGCGIASLRGKR